MSNKRLFVSEMMPNGTRDLIVTDEDSQVLEVVSEAVFGGRVDRDLSDQPLVCDGEMVFVADDDGEFLNVFSEVFQVNLDFVLERIAVSPMQDGKTIVKAILAAIK